MARQKKDTPYWELPGFVQYSKKICTAVVVFWMIYRVINLLIVLLRGDVSATLVDLVAGVDTVMICNMGFYVGKSGFENVAKILAGRQVLNRYKKQNKSLDDDEDENEETEEEADSDEDQLEG